MTIIIYKTYIQHMKENAYRTYYLWSIVIYHYSKLYHYITYHCSLNLKLKNKFSINNVIKLTLIESDDRRYRYKK